MSLDTEDIEAIARRVVELLRGQPPESARIADAATVARELGVDRDWVYAHARELGATRIGGGERGRLRFDLARILRDVAAPADNGRRPGTRPRRLSTEGRRGDVELIPYSAVRSTGQTKSGRGGRTNAPPTRPGG